MAKIIKVEEEIVLIGNPDGSVTEGRRADCNFEPNIGDEVEVFNTGDRLIVNKKEMPKENNTLPQGAININLSNSQNTVPMGYGQPQYVGGHVVNKIVYILLALFLGGIGGHKFYAGYVGSGILYLLFCWTCIPMFIALIEMIVACCRPADANGNIII